VWSSNPDNFDWTTDPTGSTPTSPWANDQTAVFTAGTFAGTYFVQIFNPVLVGSIHFEDGQATLFSSPIILTAAGGIINVTAPSARMDAPVDGTVGLTKNGTGTLTLGASPVYAGDTTVNAGTLRLDGRDLTQSSALNVTGGKFELVTPFDDNGIIKTPAVSVTGGGKIDLQDNKLITASPLGTWNGSAYTGVSGLVDAGRGNASNAQWDGSGIVTTDARAVNNNDLVSIGVARVGDFKGIAGTATTTFVGQTVLGSDAVAMVTWGGDANLDGKINVDDYGQIDFNVGSSGSVFGWYNGDFNYDGKINIDDYGIIDFSVTAQNSVFSTAGAAGDAGGLDGVAAIPEPSVVGLGGVVALIARRRRRCRRAVAMS
jgi:autotransporter-associated beta strand protein